MIQEHIFTIYPPLFEVIKTFSLIVALHSLFLSSTFFILAISLCLFKNFGCLFKVKVAHLIHYQFPNRPTGLIFFTINSTLPIFSALLTFPDIISSRLTLKKGWISLPCLSLTYGLSRWLTKFQTNLNHWEPLILHSLLNQR